MAYFAVNIDSKSRGILKYGLDHPDGILNQREIEMHLNALIGYDYKITSIDPIDEEEFERLGKKGFSYLPQQ